MKSCSGAGWLGFGSEVMCWVKENRTTGCEPLDTGDHTSSCRTQHANYLWWSVRTVWFGFFCFFCRMWHTWYILRSDLISLPRRVWRAKSQESSEQIMQLLQNNGLYYTKRNVCVWVYRCMGVCVLFTVMSSGMRQSKQDNAHERDIIIRSKVALMNDSLHSS